MELRLFTLGGLRLERAQQRAAGPPAQRRRLALLALLATARERGVSREKAFGYLWPDLSTSRARHQLSESLYVLRRFLGENAIRATADEMSLNDTFVWSDVAAFRAALDAADDDAAVAVYAGRFLDGFFLEGAAEFDQWALRERESLDRDYIRAIERIAERHHEHGDLSTAAQWWQRLVTHDPYSSRVSLRYMQALADSGDRVRAIQHAALHNQRLQEDIGVNPDPAVAQLAQKLQRAGQVHAAPTAFPDFEVVRTIGEGSVAQVFLAREVALKRLVAIKVLLPQLVHVETIRLRFEREAQSAARIHHPHVLTALRFGRTRDGAPFIVMPYIAGGTLEDRLAATGPLPLEEGKRAIAQLASALAAAHRLGIVHRDVRPANVLYDRETDRLLLADFGLAAVLDAGDATALRLTRPGEMLGDEAYASPEQLRAEPVTERADVFSLGVLAFRILTGHLPFRASASGSSVRDESVAPLRLRELLPEADEATETLLGRCLNRRPEQRPFAEEVTHLIN